MEYSSLYCKLYINTTLSIEELFFIMQEVLLGERSGIRTITNHILELDLRYNNEFDKQKEYDEDGFLFWKYYADIDSNTADREKYISLIRKLLKYLKDREISVVAACDFEDQLE